MTTHDQITFVKEYLRCRRIPYKMFNDHLIIGSKSQGTTRQPVFYSVYNLTYRDLIDAIDNEVVYDSYGYFDYIKP